MMKKTHIACVLLAAFAMMLSACSGQRRMRLGKPLKPRSSSYLVNKLEKNELQYEWIGMKLEIDLEAQGDKKGFKSTVRIKRDSMIWISITPLLGVEVAKIVITPDSLKYISKIPGDKHYFLGGIEALQEQFDAPIDYYTLQNLLVGNAIEIDKSGDFKSKVDADQYVLISEFNRKLKKVTGLDEKDVDPNDSLTVDVPNKKLERLIRRADEDELIIRRYWLNGESFKLERSLIDDLPNRRKIEIEHKDHDLYDGQWIPEKTLLTVSSRDDVVKVEIEINRLKLNKAYDMPFEIPEDYERRYY